MKNSGNNNNIYKPKPIARPSSGFSKKSNTTLSNTNTFANKGQDNKNDENTLDFGLGVSGNKISKYPKLDDKYQLSKPELLKKPTKKMGSPRSKPQQNNFHQDLNISDISLNSSQQNQQFLRYQDQQKYDPLSSQQKQDPQQGQYYNEFADTQYNNEQFQQQQQQQQQQMESNIFESYIQKPENSKMSESGSSFYSSTSNQQQQQSGLTKPKMAGDFKTYMQYKMVNPEVKEIYKNNNQFNDEFKKQTSKPFNTSQTKFRNGKKDQQQQQTQKQKQQLLQESQLSNISSGSTNNQTASKTHSQKPSQDLEGLEALTVQSISEAPSNNIQIPQNQFKKKQQKRPFKLNDLNKKTTLKLTIKEQKELEDFQDNEDEQEEEKVQYNQQQQYQQQQIHYGNNWVVQEGEGSKKVKEMLGDRGSEIKKLNNYISNMKKKKILPKDFDDMVDKNLNVLYQDEYKTIEDFEFQDIKDEDEMSQMEIQIGQQMLKEQQKKLQELNNMLEESNDDLSQVSVSEIKRSLLFITEINKKKKTQQQEQDNDDTQSIQSEQLSEQQSKITKFKSTTKNAHFIEKNKKQAFMTDTEKMEEEMDCDKLPQEAQDRLDDLLNDLDNFNEEEAFKNLQETYQNPFKQDNNTDNQELENKIEETRSFIVLDEDQQNFSMQTGVLDESVLPKDKNLREAAEERILQEKLQEVNSRLMDFAKEEQNKSQQQPNKQQLRGLCQKLKEQVEYQPGPLLQARLNDLENLKQKHVEAQKKLEKLKQENVLKECEEIRQKIEENIQKIKNGEIDENDIEKTEQDTELFLQKQEKILKLPEMNTEDLHDYSKFKNNVTICHNYINSQFEDIHKHEQQVQDKIENWKKQMEIFDLEIEQQEQEIEKSEQTQRLEEENNKMDIEALDKEIEQKVLEKQPELEIAPDLLEEIQHIDINQQNFIDNEQNSQDKIEQVQEQEQEEEKEKEDPDSDNNSILNDSLEN